MKKRVKFSVLLIMAVLLTNCATILGGSVSQSQKMKPNPGEAQRKVKVGFLIADVVLFWPGLIVDFATGAIYKPRKVKAKSILKPKKKEKEKMF